MSHRLHEEDKVSIQGWVTSAQRRNKVMETRTQ